LRRHLSGMESSIESFSLFAEQTSSELLTLFEWIRKNYDS
jgi:hypothetical protein